MVVTTGWPRDGLNDDDSDAQTHSPSSASHKLAKLSEVFGRQYGREICSFAMALVLGQII